MAACPRSRHRWTHCERDPEYRLLRRLGATGLSYLIVPALAPLSVLEYALRRPLLRGALLLRTALLLLREKRHFVPPQE